MNWDLIPLGDVLQISRIYIPIADQALYRYATLRPYPNGLALKGQKRGTDFRGKQHPMICAGQFVISRTRVQQHHWGLVQPELHESVVHRSALCFDLHPRFSQDYFAAYLATSLFSAAARACTKQGRLDIRRFLRIGIPYPSNEEQMRIADTWHYARSALQHTANMYQSIADMKSGVAADLFKNVNGVGKSTKLEDFVTLGRDESINYPLYVTTSGKLLRNQTLVDDAVGIMPNRELDLHFLQYYLEYQKPKWGISTAHIPLGLENALRALPLAIPTLYDQRKIVSILHEHDDVLHKLKAEQHELRNVIEGMMQQIFTGTLPLQEAIALFHTL